MVLKINFEYKYLLVLTCFLLILARASGLGDVIWAVNCGGDAHTDIHGIHYQKDYLIVGIDSDYGKNLQIQRVVPQDQILYQTERYHTSTFGYDIPIDEDGEYTLVLKFSEVWFTAMNQKVFDVVINKQHTVVENIDIYGKVGRGAAHDEIIGITVKNGKVKVNGETSQFVNGKIPVEFIKGERDNPKINALYVVRGIPDDVPKLGPLPGMEKGPEIPEQEREEEEIDDDKDDKPKKKRKTSGPPIQDPYATDDTSSMMLPLFVAIGAFVPLVFCLCKL